ncbi:MAG: pseudouridine synthase [Coriobacteriales bacterium]
MTAPRTTTPEGEPERLQRFLARCGVASRRHAETIIAQGRVQVNGEVVTAMGATVVSGRDVVTVDGVTVTPPNAHAYYVLHKPAGYVTTLKDPSGRPTVADLMPIEGRRLFPVGRLDRDTTGLLILTDDGELAHRLMHPRYHVDKSYVVVVRGVPGTQAFRTLEEGVDLDDGRTAPAEVELVDVAGGDATVRVVIREGRKRQVRRMFSAVGHPVVSLHRERFGPVLLGDLPEGATRPLEEDELAALRAAAGLSENEG